MTNKSFRYLKLFEGYQRGSVFSGFSEPGNWGLVDIEPSVITVPELGTVNIPIRITRDRFDGPVDLSIANPPVGITYNFTPATLGPSDLNAILTVTVAPSLVGGSLVNFVVTGLPFPVKNIQLGIQVTIDPHYTFGIPQVINIRENT